MNERTEMKMLRWMFGTRRAEKIRNKEIRGRATAMNVREKIRETRLRWLGHTETKEKEAAEKRAN